jgi:hypothetical protein
MLSREGWEFARKNKAKGRIRRLEGRGKSWLGEGSVTIRDISR